MTWIICITSPVVSDAEPLTTGLVIQIIHVIAEALTTGLVIQIIYVIAETLTTGLVIQIIHAD
jgi:hypothetical protein